MHKELIYAITELVLTNHCAVSIVRLSGRDHVPFLLFCELALGRVECCEHMYICKCTVQFVDVRDTGFQSYS